MMDPDNVPLISKKPVLSRIFLFDDRNFLPALAGILDSDFLVKKSKTKLSKKPQWRDVIQLPQKRKILKYREQQIRRNNALAGLTELLELSRKINAETRNINVLSGVLNGLSRQNYYTS